MVQFHHASAVFQRATAQIESRRGIDRVIDRMREGITFRRQDIRDAMPDGMFDVVLCRNMLLTYVDEAQHRPIVAALATRIANGGALVVGRRETMPGGVEELEPWGNVAGVFRRR